MFYERCVACGFSRFRKAATALLVTASEGSSRSTATSRRPGRGGGQGCERRHHGGPVDAAVAGPEVLVLHVDIVREGAVVVVQMHLRDARAEQFDGRADTGVSRRSFGGHGEVEVADVEADADRVEMAGLEDGEQVLRGGDLVLQVLQQQAHAERRGEGLEVLDGSERVLDGRLVPGRVPEAKVKDNGDKRDLFGGLERTLDLVHGCDTLGLFRRKQVEIGRDVARPLGVRAIGDIDGLMQHRAHIVGAKPGGEFAHGRRVGVVEVMACGEDLDGARAGDRDGVQQAGLQALLEEGVGGDSWLHCC